MSGAETSNESRRPWERARWRSLLSIGSWASDSGPARPARRSLEKHARHSSFLLDQPPSIRAATPRHAHPVDTGPHETRFGAFLKRLEPSPMWVRRDRLDDLHHDL